MSVKLAVNLAEKYLKEKFAQALLSYMSSFSGALKRIKYFIKKYYLQCKEMKSMKSKIKLIKTGKEFGTIHCLRCKDYIHNFRLEEVKMTNKVLREKSNCIVCQSNKSGFSKQKYNNKKYFLQITNNMQIHSKSCKKHTGNTFSKN